MSEGGCLSVSLPGFNGNAVPDTLGIPHRELFGFCTASDYPNPARAIVRWNLEKAMALTLIKLRGGFQSTGIKYMTKEHKAINDLLFSHPLLSWSIVLFVFAIYESFYTAKLGRVIHINIHEHMQPEDYLFGWLSEPFLVIYLIFGFSIFVLVMESIFKKLESKLRRFHFSGYSALAFYMTVLLIIISEVSEYRVKLVYNIRTDEKVDYEIPAELTLRSADNNDISCPCSVIYGARTFILFLNNDKRTYFIVPRDNISHLVY